MVELNWSNHVEYNEEVQDLLLKYLFTQTYFHIWEEPRIIVNSHVSTRDTNSDHWSREIRANRPNQEWLQSNYSLS